MPTLQTRRTKKFENAGKRKVRLLIPRDSEGNILGVFLPEEMKEIRKASKATKQIKPDIVKEVLADRVEIECSSCGQRFPMGRKWAQMLAGKLGKCETTGKPMTFTIVEKVKA